MKLKLFNLKKLLIITIIFIQVFPYTSACAVTIDEARNAIASYAVNFYKKHADEVAYYCPGSFMYRNKAYLHKTKYIFSTKAESTDSSAQYLLDCVGWSMFCIHYSTGLECGITDSNASSSALNFSSPQTPGGFTSYFSVVSGSPIPGDMVLNSHHIMVYVGDTDEGNDMIVHSANEGGGSGGGGRLSYQTVSSYGQGYSTVVRLNESAVSDITSLDTDGDPLNTSSSGGFGLGMGVEQPANMSDFYYNGIPDGKYSVTKGFFELLIENLAGIFDWLLGLFTMATRMVFVGWTAIVENLIVLTVSSVTGGGDLETISVTSTDVGSSDDAITIDKIVFNQMSIFDVNFFNYNE